MKDLCTRFEQSQVLLLSKLEGGLCTYLDCRIKLPWEVCRFIRPCSLRVPKLQEPSVKYWSEYLLHVGTVFIVSLSMAFSLGEAVFLFQSSNTPQTPQQNFPSTHEISRRSWMQLAASAHISANGELSFPLAVLQSPSLLCSPLTAPILESPCTYVAEAGVASCSPYAALQCTNSWSSSSTFSQPSFYSVNYVSTW